MFIDIEWVLTKILFLIIGAVLGLLYRDFIKRKLYKLIILLSKIFGNGSNIKGVWKATFKYPKRNLESVDTSCNEATLDDFTEIIQIYEFSNFVIGEIIPSDLNTPERNVDKNKLRIIGKFIKGTTHITGNWFHPKEKQNYHGAFQLDLLPCNRKMKGRWIGFNSKRNVDCNEWVWEKID